MEESGKNISGGLAPPIQTSNTYVGLAQKEFNFATAADAFYWAFLQGNPICKVFNNDGEQIASVSCVYESSGTTGIVTAKFTTRVNTAGATGISRTYFFRFDEIVSDISPSGIGIYH